MRSRVTRLAVMHRHSVLGGTSLAFSPLDPATFVVGTEGGGLLKCLIPSAQRSAKALAQAKQVKMWGQ